MAVVCSYLILNVFLIVYFNRSSLIALADSNATFLQSRTEVESNCGWWGRSSSELPPRQIYRFPCRMTFINPVSTQKYVHSMFLSILNVSESSTNNLRIKCDTCICLTCYTSPSIL